jgi:L-threonylcarbamoyladenylate synthase
VLADLDGVIDLVLDSGPTALGLESTVLDITCEPPRLLRPGPITHRDLESALSGRPVTTPTAGESAERPSSPGQLPVHYSPRTPSYRVEVPKDLAGIPHPEEFILVAIGDGGRSPSLPFAEQFRLESPAEAASLLYDVLHRCDARKAGAIVVVMPPDRPEWLAVRDRLLRATRPLPQIE